MDDRRQEDVALGKILEGIEQLNHRQDRFEQSIHSRLGTIEADVSTLKLADVKTKGFFAGIAFSATAVGASIAELWHHLMR